MLYCNNELVQLKDKQHSKLVQEFEKIQRMPSIKIVTTQKIERNETGHFEKLPAVCWPFRSTTINETGESETWVYTKSAPRSKKDGILEFSERSFVIQDGVLTINPKTETDKAYFILNLSGILKSGLFKLEDIEKEDAEEVNIIGEKSTVEFYLCSKHSPIYSDHLKLKTLGASWGIADSSTMGIDTLRKKILNAVNASQRNYENTRRGVNEFVAEVAGEDAFSEYRAIMQLSIDKKIIGWNEGMKGWYFMDGSEFTEGIVLLAPYQLQNKREVLFDTLRKNAFLFEQLKKTVYPEDPDKDAKTGLPKNKLRKKQ